MAQRKEADAQVTARIIRRAQAVDFKEQRRDVELFIQCDIP